MIVGSGDIASVLNDRDGALFFASGVSNSQCTNEKEFLRELELLLDQRTKYCIFYFSTISINTVLSRYTLHKLAMERMIKSSFKNYNIIRIGNIDWGKNPHTFINAIRAKKERGEPVQIRDEWKYMISKEQLLLLTDNLPLTGQNTISVFGDMKKVKDLI